VRDKPSVLFNKSESHQQVVLLASHDTSNILRRFGI
jgi:hypothetical protein